VLVVKPFSKYEINNGIIEQISISRHLKCEDSVINYTWNGSDFLIGPVLTSYSGKYVMCLQNNSNMWENRTFVIWVMRKFKLLSEYMHDKLVSQILFQKQSDNSSGRYKKCVPFN
jgi:hypothetical protein